MFKPYRSHLPDKRYEAVMFINFNKDFQLLLFLFNQHFKVFVGVNGREEGRFDTLGQLNVTPSLGLYFGFSILLTVLYYGVVFLRFSEYFC